MLSPTVFAPVSAYRILGWKVVLLIVPTVVTFPLKAFEDEARDWYTLLISIVLGILSALVLVHVACSCDIERTFMSWPWKYEQAEILQRPETDPRQLQVYCPFTFDVATHRCNVCGTCVAESALHTSEAKLISKMPVGGDIVSWDLAAEAVICKDPIKGRKRLDSILAFKGNYLVNAVAPSCIGCATWAKADKLIPRVVICHSCLSLMLALGPYSFGAAVEEAGVAQIFTLTSTMSTCLAISGVLGAIMSLSMAVAFTEEHSLHFKDNCMKVPAFMTPVLKWFASGRLP